jgi:KDO2-lipid IV(A) lauroyltransferase
MVVGESPFKDVYRGIVWGPWRWALERSPPGWEFRANRAAGTLAGSLPSGTRQRVVKNLRRAFPHRDDLDDVARRAFGAHFCNQYASFSFSRVTPATVDRYLRFTGLEHLDAARAAGEGVVLMHPHMGPAQLPLCALGAMGHPVHQIGGGEPEGEKSRVGRWATDLRHELEGRLPAKLHDGNAYLRGLVRALRAGEIVFTACDGTGGGKEIGRRVERTVLGQRMRIPVGGPWLAWQGRARLHPLHTVRDGARHHAIIGPRIPVDGDLDGAADATAGFLEAVLTAHPEEWLFWDAFQPGGLLA